MQSVPVKSGKYSFKISGRAAYPALRGQRQKKVEASFSVLCGLGLRIKLDFHGMPVILLVRTSRRTSLERLSQRAILKIHRQTRRGASGLCSFLR